MRFSSVTGRTWMWRRVATAGRARLGADSRVMVIFPRKMAAHHRVARRFAIPPHAGEREKNYGLRRSTTTTAIYADAARGSKARLAGLLHGAHYRASTFDSRFLTVR